METEHKTLIIKQLSGNASEDEIIVLDQWRKSDAANENTYTEVQKIWVTMGKAKADFTPNVDVAWINFNQKRMAKKSGWPTVFKMAAALLICVALGFFAKQYFVKNKEQKLHTHHKHTNSIEATANNDIIVETTDSIKEVLLPDSSVAMVNINSTLKYTNGSSRLVDVDGEAYFEVIPSDKNFIVSTQYLTIKVIGTTFNVKSLKTDEANEVIVEEGTVEVTSKKNEIINVVLSKGEKCIYDIKNDSFTTEKVKTKHKWWNKFSNRFKNFLERIRLKKAAKQSND